MSTEQSLFVCIPDVLAPDISKMAMRAASALERSKKLPPGDRTEAIRFESLHAVIDQIAIAALANGEPYVSSSDICGKEIVGSSVLLPGAAISHPVPEQVAEWNKNGSVVVELHLPHFSGETVLGGEAGRGPPKTASRWRSAVDHPRDAAQERFEYLLSKAATDSLSEEGAILPSNVTNTALTESLRRNVQVKSSNKRMDLPVQYRDGSRGPRFPVHVLDMSDQIPKGWRILRFTLMSIRHVVMDLKVDGAWLRNSKVSVKRHAGLTDEMVFETSLRQLLLLDPNVPTLIEMYQTGLAPAILGFYRAVTYHLIEYPGSISVLPRYYKNEGEYQNGTIWATK